MVLVVEVLLGVGILVGVYRVATSDAFLAPAVEPDGPPRIFDDRPLSADDVATFRLPRGFGYRKADVDLLLDRVARQLPRAGEEPTDTDTDTSAGVARVPLTKTQEVGHG